MSDHSEDIPVENRFKYRVDVLYSNQPGLPVGTTYGFKSVGGRPGQENYKGVLKNRLVYGPRKRLVKKRIGTGNSATTEMDLTWHEVTSDPLLDVDIDVQTYDPYVTRVRSALQGGEILPLQDIYNKTYLLPLPFRWNDDSMTGVREDARNRFLVQASSPPTVELAVFLAELGKSRDMIINRTQSIADRFLSFRRDVERARFNINEPARLRVAISKLWLEYNFGWRPLIKDIRKAHKELYRTVNKPPVTRIGPISSWSVNDRVNRPTPGIAPARESWNETYNSGYSVKELCPGIVGEYNVKETGWAFTHFYGAVRGEVEGIPGSHTLKKWGIHPSEVASYAWELTPYSWAFDYFSSLSDLLKVDWDISSRLSWICRVSGYEALAEVTVYPISGYGDHPYFKWNNRHTIRTSILKKRVHREDLTGMSGVPDVHFKTLYSPTQLINLLAVLTK